MSNWSKRDIGYIVKVTAQIMLEQDERGHLVLDDLGPDALDRAAEEGLKYAEQAEAYIRGLYSPN